MLQSAHILAVFVVQCVLLLMQTHALNSVSVSSKYRDRRGTPNTAARQTNATYTSQSNGDINSKRAIVTLFHSNANSNTNSQSNGNHESTRAMLENFEWSLRRSGYRGETIVLYPSDLGYVPSTASRSITPIAVDAIRIHHSEERYRDVLTKLHGWTLYAYDHLIYVDLDFFFQSNPESAFDSCSALLKGSNKGLEKAVLCACPDKGQSGPAGFIKRHHNINAGFLVLQPDRNTFDSLMALTPNAANFEIPDNELLVAHFHNKWRPLDLKYNFQLRSRGRNESGPGSEKIPPDVVAIHETMSVLQERYHDIRKIWNQPRDASLHTNVAFSTSRERVFEHLRRVANRSTIRRRWSDPSERGAIRDANKSALIAYATRDINGTPNGRKVPRSNFRMFNRSIHQNLISSRFRHQTHLQHTDGYNGTSKRDSNESSNHLHYSQFEHKPQMQQHTSLNDANNSPIVSPRVSLDQIIEDYRFFWRLLAVTFAFGLMVMFVVAGILIFRYSKHLYSH